MHISQIQRKAAALEAALIAQAQDAGHPEFKDLLDQAKEDLDSYIKQHGLPGLLAVALRGPDYTAQLDCQSKDLC